MFVYRKLRNSFTVLVFLGEPLFPLANMTKVTSSVFCEFRDDLQQSTMNTGDVLEEDISWTCLSNFSFSRYLVELNEVNQPA